LVTWTIPAVINWCFDWKKNQKNQIKVPTLRGGGAGNNWASGYSQAVGLYKLKSVDP
jgi:hypothetical protein